MAIGVASSATRIFSFDKALALKGRNDKRRGEDTERRARRPILRRIQRELRPPNAPPGYAWVTET